MDNTVDYWLANRILNVLVQQPVTTLGELLIAIRVRRGYSTVLLRMQELNILSIDWDGKNFGDENTIRLSGVLVEARLKTIEATVYRIPLSSFLQYIEEMKRMRMPRKENQ